MLLTGDATNGSSYFALVFSVAKQPKCVERLRLASRDRKRAIVSPIPSAQGDDRELTLNGRAVDREQTRTTTYDDPPTIRYVVRGGLRCGRFLSCPAHDQVEADIGW
jgi:hypothetical protein